jgi:hypothetical protein
LNTPIPAGQKAFVRIYMTSSVAIPYQNLVSGTFDTMQTSTGTLPDVTMGGSITNSSNTGCYPLGIIGSTSLKSLIIWGDSITWGTGTGFDAFGNIGPACRGLGKNFAYTKFARNGEGADSIVANGAANRRLLLPYANCSVNQLGVNDFNFSSASILSSIQTIAGWSSAAFPGCTSFAGTVTPRTNSTDNWTTVVNQTLAITNTQHLNLVGYNDLLRAGGTGLTGIFDVASAVESSLDSGLWAAPPAITGDGLHPNSAGETVQEAVWNPALIH